MCFQILLCLQVLTNNIEYQCPTDVWERKRQVTEAGPLDSKMQGPTQLLSYQVKETSGICRHGPASLDINSKHTSILMPSEKEINSKGSHLSPTSTLKILTPSHHCAHYFW